MQQKALLVFDQEDWLLITDDDEPERLWQDEDSAPADLKQEGWNVEVGPSTLRTEVPNQPGRQVWGYVLARSVH